MEKAVPMTTKAHAEWFHGSPEILDILRSGSTVTPVITLARAFSHKPTELRIEVCENENVGKRQIRISHDGIKHGYLYCVIVDNPETDLIQHPDSNGAPGEEMLTTHILALEFLEEVPIRSLYEYSEIL